MPTAECLMGQQVGSRAAQIRRGCLETEMTKVRVQAWRRLYPHCCAAPFEHLFEHLTRGPPVPQQIRSGRNTCAVPPFVLVFVPKTILRRPVGPRSNAAPQAVSSLSAAPLGPTRVDLRHGESVAKNKTSFHDRVASSMLATAGFAQLWLTALSYTLRRSPMAAFRS